MDHGDLMDRIFRGRCPPGRGLGPDVDGGAFVYFFRAESGGPIKIGTTDRAIRSRLRGVQTGNPERLACLACLPGGRRVEREVHAAFAALRIRGGEWFHAEPALLEFIAACGTPPPT